MSREETGEELIKKPTKLKPAKTPEVREQQLISLAMDQAEELLRKGKAPTQVLVHYLKLASPTTKIEKDILSEQKKLIVAKTEALQSSKKYEEMLNDYLQGIHTYNPPDEEELNNQ